MVANARTPAAIDVLLTDLLRRLETVEARVTGIMDEDRIAAEVAARIKTRRNELFSWPVKLAAILTAASATASAFVALWQAVG